MIHQQFSGHSGCEVWREGNFVFKRCPESYVPRLQAQTVLQEEYRYEFGEVVYVPKIYDVRDGTVRMEYVPWLGWLDFVAVADYAVMGAAIERVCALVQLELLFASSAKTPSALWSQRLALALDRLPPSHDNTYFGYAMALGRLIQSREEWECPIGLCHGDLTTSNLLFNPNGGAIAALDVLDCCPRTPLWDVVKLKQSAYYHWTTVTTPNGRDGGLKVLFCDAWLARRMVDSLQPALSLPVMKVVEALNYLRIVPYARTEAVHNLLRTALDDTLTGE